MKRSLKVLSVVTTVGMFLVLVMGSTVTNTGSEQGCGHSWPLCHGRFVPQFAVATAIEFAHRVDAALETILVLALAGGLLLLYRHRREAQILSSLMVAFLFLQAGLGAWAVMYPQMAAALALHFGVSLIAFASVLLATTFLFEEGGSDALRWRPIPPAFRATAWAVTAYSYVVVYLGAYVRHTDADQSCSGWPLCNHSLLPAFGSGVAPNFFHRVAALLLAALICTLVLWSRRLRVERPDLYRASLYALASVVLQSVSGALVVFTRVDLFSALAHAALAGLMFGSLCYLCIHTIAPRVGRVHKEHRPALVASVAQERTGSSQ